MVLDFINSLYTPDRAPSYSSESCLTGLGEFLAIFEKQEAERIIFFGFELEKWQNSFESRTAEIVKRFLSKVNSLIPVSDLFRYSTIFGF
jgi:hypothetical protein